MGHNLRSAFKHGVCSCRLLKSALSLEDFWILLNLSFGRDRAPAKSQSRLCTLCLNLGPLSRMMEIVDFVKRQTAKTQV